jgi:hypothetical protein
MKKQKTNEGKQVDNMTSSDGPVPIQMALTPFPPNVDTAKVLAAMKTKGTTRTALANPEISEIRILEEFRLLKKNCPSVQRKELSKENKMLETADPSRSTSGGRLPLSPHQCITSTVLGGSSMVRQEADQLSSVTPRALNCFTAWKLSCEGAGQDSILLILLNKET